ncbi:cytochrome c5 family protein [Pseudomonas sp. R5(2019)]|uniref:c-type cytochrome n=1 Tax=Pseudomonas sp. R5(2019) TaxID=2697566 RepID=UPI001413516A|nr:c-type cytochrome [Pseudomonas sp. R5(2019)]NBA96950.1 cytochrome c5 family protein [Pseudomonas sp. R5(2019)]
MTNWLLAAGFMLPFYSVQAAQDPQAVFDRACGACHAGQLPAAPEKGDVKAWAPRLDKGTETLVQHVTQGFKAMPPRGLCMDCNAEDYRAVIQWMSQ